MQDLMDSLMKLMPDYTEKLVERYDLLRTIYYLQPIGRRGLSSKLKIGERIIRAETDVFRSQGLLETSLEGMTVTKKGEKLLVELKHLISRLSKTERLEEQLLKIMNIKEVRICRGNIENSDLSVKELAREASYYLKDIIRDGDIIAITGGTTIKSVVDSFPEDRKSTQVIVAASRGGMGKNIETQANTLASVLARKLGGTYKMLHLPDNISEEAMELLLKDESIKKTKDIINKSTIILYSCGNAEHIARKREVKEEVLNEILEKGAVGEAYGCYFDEKGSLIYLTPSSGINTDNFKHITVHIAVAGGLKKARAIYSSIKDDSKAILFTDQAAAEEIIRLYGHEVV